jgi:hypothetical protein
MLSLPWWWWKGGIIIENTSIEHSYISWAKTRLSYAFARHEGV